MSSAVKPTQIKNNSLNNYKQMKTHVKSGEKFFNSDKDS